ncbi:MAG: histidine kinase [Clostridiales Family XIII bacterium]|jgi:sensor histidine kinase YesM|nr:histidine kinase [Clostridiales Family XIII bacterium]
MRRKMRRKISLFAVFMALCVLLMIVPAVCSIVYFNNIVSDRLEDNAIETVDYYADNFAENTTDIFDTLDETTYFLLQNKNTQEIMAMDAQPSQQQRLTLEKELNHAIQIGNHLDSGIVTGIYLINDGVEYLSVLRSGSILGTLERIQSVYAVIKDRNVPKEFYSDDTHGRFCYYIVDYFDMDTMTIIGKIMIEIDANELLDTAPIEGIYPHTSVLLRTQEEQIISFTKPIPDYSEHPPLGEDEYIEIGGTSYYHALRELHTNKLLVDVYIPESDIFDTISQISKMHLFFIIVMILITLFIGGLCIYLLSKPLRDMLHATDKLGAGDLTSRMQPTPYRETERVARTFNDMAGNIETLVDEVYQSGLMLREAEFQMLESQIRPHFIFNILHWINVRCMEEKQYDICKIVDNLAKLLRSGIINKDKQKITMKQELEYVRYYLELQKERFGSKLNYDINVEDESILAYYLPKLTLQPLVENSIVHGIEQKRNGGNVTISIWEDTDALYLRVSDDGVGFDTSAFDAINLDANHVYDDSNNHVALANIARRIRLLYGDAYGMEIESTVGDGTKVTLTLPIDEDAS